MTAPTDQDRPRMQLAVIGADGATGREVVAQALARGHRVRALEQSWEGRTPPKGAEPREADVLSPGLEAHFRDCDAVISAIGLGLSLQSAIDPPPLYTEGSLNIIKGMRAADVARLIVISATFVETRDRGPIWFRLTSAPALSRIFDQMAEMERLLAAAPDIDWTAIRPGWLMEGELTEDYSVRPDVIPPDLIRTRHADLAHFMLHCAESGAWSRATPAIARPEPASASAPDKILAELAG